MSFEQMQDYQKLNGKNKTYFNVSIKLKRIFVFGCLSNKGLLFFVSIKLKRICFSFEFSNHSDMNSSLFDIQRLYFFKCVIWHPLLHSSPNCYLSHLIMNSVTHDILWLEFFLMCHLIPSTTFKPCNSEFSHVWYPMTGVLLSVSSDTLLHWKSKLFI